MTASPPQSNRFRQAAGRARARLLATGPLTLLAAFAAGFFLGWLVMGWVIWPVQWSDVYPDDLRDISRSDYLLMAAESYAQTNDIAAASRRLQYWTQEELAMLMAQLALRLQEEGQPDGAARVQTLTERLRLTEAAAAPSPPPDAGMGRWVRLAAGALAALLLLVVLVALARQVWLLWRKLSRPAAAPAPAPTPAPAPDPLAAAFGDALNRQLTAAEALEVEPVAAALPPPAAPPLTPAAPSPVPAPAVRPASPPPPPAPAARPPAPAPPAPAARPPAPPAPAPTPPVVEQLFRFHGEPDFDQIETLRDAQGQYLGEFGVGVAEIDGDDWNRVRALEVWLFDKSDTRTLTAHLLPPAQMAAAEAAEDETLCIPLRVGQPIELETATLWVEGSVERVSFHPGDEGAIKEVFLTLRGGGR